MRTTTRVSRHVGRNEHGAVAVVVAILTCFVLLPLGAFAIDIGIQRVARRDLQAVADVVALDLGRQIDGRTQAQLQPTLQQLANASTARNPSPIARSTSIAAQLGTIDPDKYLSDPTTYFTPTTSPTAIPNAVRVTASGRVDFTIAGGSGGVSRTAIGTASNTGCFQIGSFALNLATGNSPLLNWLLRDALNVSAISFDGLADANVSLLGIAAELGAGSVDELLALDRVSLGQLYLATARALSKAGGHTADVALLNQLVNLGVGSLPHIRLADLLDVEAGKDAALGTSLNVLDLVSTSAFIANGTNALSIPGLTVGIPGIASVNASLKVIEKPLLHCSTTPAETSQVDLNISVSLANLDLLLLQTAVNVSINVKLAPATATRTALICGPSKGMDITVRSGLLALTVSPFLDLKLLGAPVLNISGSAGTQAPPVTTNFGFRNPPDAYETPKSYGTSAILPTLSTSDLHVTLFGSTPGGLLVSSLLSSVLNDILVPIVNPLITAVNTLVLNPLTQLLGIKAGGAQILVKSPITCGRSSLAG